MASIVSFSFYDIDATPRLFQDLWSGLDSTLFRIRATLTNPPIILWLLVSRCNTMSKKCSRLTRPYLTARPDVEGSSLCEGSFRFYFLSIRNVQQALQTILSVILYFAVPLHRRTCPYECSSEIRAGTHVTVDMACDQRCVISLPCHKVMACPECMHDSHCNLTGSAQNHSLNHHFSKGAPSAVPILLLCLSSAATCRRGWQTNSDSLS